MTALAGPTKRGGPKTSAIRKLAWCGMALLCGAVALASYRYLLGRGPVPDTIAANRHFDPWIVFHAGGATTALLLGPVQFLPARRRRRTLVHRVVKRLYVVGCVSGGVAALVLATGVSAGPIAGAGLGALGMSWLVTTGVALREILTGRVASHERWMIRSFALTLSAVTLRMYLPLSGALGIAHMPAYRVIAWVCWVPNMLVAEWYLGRRQPAVQLPQHG